MIKRNAASLSFQSPLPQMQWKPKRQGFAEFKALADLLKDLTGINLPQNDKNLSLINSRLISILRKYELSSYSEYLDLLGTGGPEYIQEFISSLTTNTTHFFREDSHFDTMKSLLPELLERNKKKAPFELRIWCAACSTGQEVYSIAITLLEALAQMPAFGPLSGLQIKILATDIDKNVLATAASGIYTRDEVDKLPGIFRMNYMDRAFNGNENLVKRRLLLRGPVLRGDSSEIFLNKDGSSDAYKIKDSVRSLVTFAQFNLTAWQYHFQYKFDMVFCRNVLIYFDQETASRVVNQLIGTLSERSYLFLGHSETGVLRSNLIKPIANAVYQKIADSKTANKATNKDKKTETTTEEGGKA